ncbi:MAG: regulatory protein RecX [Bacteroidota bacterium]
MKGKDPSEYDHSLTLEKIRYFCSYRERSEKEAELKLRALQAPPGKIKSIIELMKEEGFLSDERYARAFVRGKFRVNHWGRIKIAFELRARKIPEKMIAKAMSEIDEDAYLAQLGEMIEKKVNDIRRQKKEENISVKKLKTRDKLFNFALGKGYEHDLIRQILDELKI